MQPKATYKIRKNGKQDVFEGSLEDVRKWLRQNSINSSDAMRREGYQVMELDEFWGLVKDFPELGLTEREGRAALVAKFKVARYVLVAGLLLLLASLGLLAVNHWIPAHRDQTNKEDYERRLSAQEKTIEEMKTTHGKEKAVLTVNLNAADKLKKETEGKLAKKEQELAASQAVITRLVSSVEGLKSELKDAVDVRDSLKRNLDITNRRIPIFTTWSETLVFPRKLLTIRNQSNQTLGLSVTVKYASGNSVKRVVDILPGQDAVIGEDPVDLEPGSDVVIDDKNRPEAYDTISIKVPK